MLTSNSNEETILEQALGFSSNEARQAYLQGACGGDQALRARIESLIAAHEEAGGFLQQKTTRVSPDPSAGRADEQAGSVIGRYKLLQQIGEGGCGVVYMAEQEEPVRRRVALKVIKLGMDTKSVIARFEAERQALALMDHPNIAKVLDAGATDSGRPYFVMELVRGIKITEYCDQNNLATKERLGLFIQVCHAIQHAHQKGIIHRDIKPSNILVSLHDGVPVPVVIDFGIAKATEQRLTDKTLFTAFEQFIGTPAYTSPEQAEMSRLDIDTRSDIYSLGVLLYEMLTGRPPFDPKELMASGLDVMRRTIREQEPPRPSTRLATLVGEDLTTVAKRRSAEPAKLIHLLRGDLDWIVMKCLEKDRTRRYDTANGLAMDLSRYLTDEPVLARPASAGYRFRKAFRRHKLAYAAAAAVGISLVGGLGISTWLWRRESEARVRATAAEHAAQTAQAKETALRQDAEKRLYAANLNLVQQAWNDDNIIRMRRLLGETAGSPYRGLEWNYWQRQIHRETMTLRGHERELCSVAWSADGERIVTGSFDYTARVWNAETGQELLTLRGHSNGVSAVAFSVDRERVVTGGYDRTVRVWDAASGRELLAIPVPSAPVGGVAFSPDCRRIASCACYTDPDSPDSTVRIWDTTTGSAILACTGHRANVNAVAFTPDGSRLVSASDDHTARIWDATTGRELLAFDRHPGAVLALAISADGRRVVSGGRGDWGVRVWELATGRELYVLRGHSSAVSAVAISRDGRRIASGGDDTTVRVWDGISGDALFTLKGHGMPVNGLAFSADGQRIVSAAGDWMNLNPPDRAAKIWDAAQQRETVVLGRPGVGRVSFAPVSPDGTRVATGSELSVQLWDPLTGSESDLFRANTNATGPVALSLDGGKIVTRGGNTNIAIVWDARSGRELVTLHGHERSIQYAAFSPDGRQIATGSEDSTARLWDADTGQTRHVLRGHREHVYGVAFSPDGHRLVTASQDRTAKVWNVADGSEVFTYRGHSHVLADVAFSPDGQRIITASSDLTARVWEAATGKDLFALEGHQSQVWAVAYTPDGRRIITGSYDGTAKVWDAADGRELLTLRAHLSYIRRVACFPDSRRFVTASWDGTARIWEAATDAQVATWASQER